MNGTIRISVDELTAIANSLKSQGESILSTYKGDCAAAIQMSSECLQLSGLDTHEFSQALEKIYSKLNEKIAALADFLTNVVVAEYSALSEAIINSFNNDFANQISGLLGISVGGAAAGSGPVSTPPKVTTPCTPKPTTPCTPTTTPQKNQSNDYKIVTDCNGVYKVYTGCGGTEVKVKVDTDRYRVTTNCSGQNILVEKPQPSTTPTTTTTGGGYTPKPKDTEPGWKTVHSCGGSYQYYVS